MSEMLPIVNTNIAAISDLTVLSKTKEFKAEYFGASEVLGQQNFHPTEVKLLANKNDKAFENLNKSEKEG